jgi:hypothetical protein
VLFENFAMGGQPNQKKLLPQVVAQRHQGLSHGVEFFLHHRWRRP